MGGDDGDMYLLQSHLRKKVSAWVWMLAVKRMGPRVPAGKSD